MKINFLRAADGTPLAKTLDESGKTVSSYPMVAHFDSLEFEVSNLEEFAEAIKVNAEAGHCLLKGLLDRTLQDESRAGHTDAYAPTQWLCLDYDGEDAYASIDEYLEDLGLGNTSYVLQYSASAGFTPTTQHKSHVIMMLTEPTEPGVIKRWAMHMNLTKERLKARVGLNRRDDALSWALDITTGQNDKLLYIAPPICPKDPIPERVVLRKKEREATTISEAPTLERLHAEQNKLIDELRAAKGLPKKKWTTSMHNGEEVLKGIAKCDVTGLKEERGFYYINLNGGDSWGYYFPKDNIDVVKNFKGEPNVLLKELNPELYHRLSRETRVVTRTDVRPLAVHDPETDAYWACLYDRNTGRLTAANQIGSKDRIFDFLAQYGEPKPDYIPDWTVTLDPRDLGRQVDFDRKQINLFRPTEYLLATPNDNAIIPTTIRKAIQHICVDEATTTHFINWLAVVFQTRSRAGTAWVFQGTFGTGKGLLFHKILTPIFGPAHTAIINTSNLEDQFNSYLENTLILFVDEANLTDVNNEKKVWNKIKSIITEDRITIRGMRRNPLVRENFINVIMPTNEYTPLKLEKEDRRINISPRQESPLPLTDHEIDELIPQELMQFCQYLAAYKIDRQLARKPLKNEAREDMIDASKTSIDLFFDAIIQGDLSFFRGFIDKSPGLMSNIAYIDFENTVNKWTQSINLESFVPRGELATAYQYLQGAKEMTPTKFGRMCGHHGVKLAPMDGSPTRTPGVKVTWKLAEGDTIQPIKAVERPVSALESRPPEKPNFTKAHEAMQ